MLHTTADPALLRIMRTATEPMPLRIMTFNLRYGTAPDGPNSWPHRRAHAADIVSRFAPAILGTQEGLEEQLGELQGHLTRHYERFGLPRAKGDEHVQVFYDPTVVERLDGGTFWLSTTPNVPGSKSWDSSNPRIATWCRFRLLATQQEFFYVNTHLDNSGHVARLMGAKVIWDQLRQIMAAARASGPLILGGDFNTFRRTNVYEFLTQDPSGPEFVDAWLGAEVQIGDISCTYHEFIGPAYDKTPHRDWIPADIDESDVKGGNHIDWIFSRPRLPVFVTEVITEDRHGRYPSDHYPVMTTMLFPGTAELPPPLL